MNNIKDNATALYSRARFGRREFFVTVTTALVIQKFSLSHGLNQSIENEFKAEKDSVLIKGGKYLIGSDTKGDHSPAHIVQISDFYIDKYEVTNSKYLKFCKSTGYKLPEFWESSMVRSGPVFPNHPVVGVSWIDAIEYAKWCGKRLPTEAEWEFAARGGLKGRNYPLGDTISPSDGNYTESDKKGPVEVGSYPSNGFALFDMLGNVAEWVWDRYDPDYYTSSPSKDPKGPETGKFHVIRGGGWHTGPLCNRVFFRNALPANWVDFNVGFRCAQG